MRDLVLSAKQFLERCIPARLRSAIRARPAILIAESSVYLHRSVQILGIGNVAIGGNTCVSADTWLNVNHRNEGEIAIQIGENCFIGRRNFFSSGKKIEI